MASIKIHAGDFGKTTAQVIFGTFQIAEPVATWKNAATYSLSMISNVEQASEESVKKWGGTIGWGVVGATLLGPVGLLAGLLLGGKKQEVTFIAVFNDGKKILATADSKTYTKLLAASF